MLLQKLNCNHDDKWMYFAKYWVGMHLRKLNPALASNSFPHSESVPPFYKFCLQVFDKFKELCTDCSFGKITNKQFYKILS